MNQSQIQAIGRPVEASAINAGVGVGGKFTEPGAANN